MTRSRNTPDRGRISPEQGGLAGFSAWLDAYAPRHGALRTPVHLEPDAPAGVRELWDAVGWSDALLETRPERTFADPGAEKVIRGWFADARVRERWGVASPREAMEVVRTKLPKKHRFVRAVSTKVFFTDEDAGTADPPVLDLDASGVVSAAWPSYVQMIVWQACRRVASERSTEVAAPVPSAAGALRPFAPAYSGCWELADGVWGLEPSPARRAGAVAADASWSVLYQSPARYFRYVLGLPDEELRRHFVGTSCLHYLAVKDGKRLDPQHPSVPSFRGYTSPCGPKGETTLFRGLAEVDGLRLWLESRSGAEGAFVYAEPEQLAEVKAFLKREKMTVYEQIKPQKDRFAVEPTSSEIAAAKTLHDRARAAAEGSSA